MDLLKELGMDGLHKLYAALGLRQHEVAEAESLAHDREWKVKKVFRFWSDKEGYSANVDAVFAALDVCEFTEIKEKLQEKWTVKGRYSKNN